MLLARKIEFFPNILKREEDKIRDSYGLKDYPFGETYLSSKDSVYGMIVLFKHGSTSSGSLFKPANCDSHLASRNLGIYSSETFMKIFKNFFISLGLSGSGKSVFNTDVSIDESGAYRISTKSIGSLNASTEKSYLEGKVEEAIKLFITKGNSIQKKFKKNKTSLDITLFDAYLCLVQSAIEVANIIRNPENPMYHYIASFYGLDILEKIGHYIEYSYNRTKNENPFSIEEIENQIMNSEKNSKQVNFAKKYIEILRNIPPAIDQNEALCYDSKGKNDDSNSKYANCAEISLANIFNIMLYNNKKTSEYLWSLGKLENAPLRIFIEENLNRNSCSNINLEFPHDEWGKLISNSKGISYCYKKSSENDKFKNNELNTPWENMLKMICLLLKDDELEKIYEKFKDYKNLEESSKAIDSFFEKLVGKYSLNENLHINSNLERNICTEINETQTYGTIEVNDKEKKLSILVTTTPEHAKFVSEKKADLRNTDSSILMMNAFSQDEKIMYISHLFNFLISEHGDKIDKLIKTNIVENIARILMDVNIEDTYIHWQLITFFSYNIFLSSITNSKKINEMITEIKNELKNYEENEEKLKKYTKALKFCEKINQNMQTHFSSKKDKVVTLVYNEKEKTRKLFEVKTLEDYEKVIHSESYRALDRMSDFFTYIESMFLYAIHSDCFSKEEIMNLWERRLKEVNQVMTNEESLEKFLINFFRFFKNNYNGSSLSEIEFICNNATYFLLKNISIKEKLLSSIERKIEAYIRDNKSKVEEDANNINNQAVDYFKQRLCNNKFFLETTCKKFAYYLEKDKILDRQDDQDRKILNKILSAWNIEDVISISKLTKELKKILKNKKYLKVRQTYLDSNEDFIKTFSPIHV